MPGVCRKQGCVGMWTLHHGAVGKAMLGRAHWNRQDGQGTGMSLSASPKPTEMFGWPHILTLLLLC